MSGGIEHSERSVNAWMVAHLTTRNGITTAPRQAGRVPAPTNDDLANRNALECQWLELIRHPEAPGPCPLTIDTVIGVVSSLALIWLVFFV